MILMATFIMACQRYGKVTSGGMWLTWLLYTICGIPELYYYLNLGFHPNVRVYNSNFLNQILIYSEYHSKRSSSFCCILCLVSMCCY